MANFYPWQYNRKRRMYNFEPVPDCKTVREFIHEFSKRTKISKKDTIIIMKYLREFLGDAIESNAKINFASIFKLDYRIMKPRRCKDVTGQWTEYPAVVRPKITIPRRLADKGRMFLSDDEYEMLMGEDDEE